jgi:hypothetical protein
VGILFAKKSQRFPSLSFFWHWEKPGGHFF